MSDTRALLIEQALDLMQTHTLAGFSFQDLAERVGIRKASIYHYFPSKADLAAAVLHYVNDRFMQSVARLDEHAPAHRIDAFFNHFGRYLGPGEKVCPGGAMSAVWDGLNSDVRAAAQCLIFNQRTWMAKAVREGQADGTIKKLGSTPAEMAVWIMANLSGAMLGARITGRVGDFDNVVLHLRRLLFTNP